jgi:L-seryl-tRNA(Ser) seleniumtransferase
MSHELLRQLPSVDRLLGLSVTATLVERYGAQLTTEALRTTLSDQRHALLSGVRSTTPTDNDLVAAAVDWLVALTEPTLRPVINAAGVIVHTNLGRAPLSGAALQAIQDTAAGYATLEYDLVAGERGSRSVHAERLLTRLTGAEGAFVANNNAAAVLLMLTALCAGREVIISRGQLVEIGGGFRVPDVMAQSGCRLVEVGTTNRTHLRDFESAITDDTAAILVAHHSNYKIIGFTSEPSLSELAGLAQERELVLLFDQGSGALLNTTAIGLDPEPMVQSALEDGADLVAFSGDKLLGGPQAGILCGRADLVARCKRHPLARAVRPDKLCLSALSATLMPYLAGRAHEEIPVWRMMSRDAAAIDADARAWADRLRAAGVPARVVPGMSTVGGGSLPGNTLPTTLVAIATGGADTLTARLRRHDPPVIARISDDAVVLDPRTVLPDQVDALLEAVVAIATAQPAPNERTLP